MTTTLSAILQGSHATRKNLKNLNYILYFPGLEKDWNLLKSVKKPDILKAKPGNVEI